MRNSSNLIFYYPSNEGAPSSVGRAVFEQLLKKRDELPFDNICIFTPSKNEISLKSKFKGVEIYTEKTIKKLPLGIVHIPISPHLFPNSKFLLHIYAKLKKYPLIFNYHGDIRTEVSYNYKNNHVIDYSYIPTYILLPSLLKSSNQLIVHSYLFKNLVSDKYGVKDAKVIPNAVEDYWYLPEYQIIPKKEGYLEIFYHGRLSAEKGVDLLIKGFHKFLSTYYGSKAVLYIAGNGPQKRSLEKLVNGLKIDTDVSFLGNLDKKTIKAYLKKADVAIYPSLWDNFPLSFIEAFACADCPVFFSKKAGIYDFVEMDNKAMYSFDPDVDVICDIIDKASRCECDQTVVKYQKNFAHKYKWDDVVNDYIDVYSKFIA